MASKITNDILDAQQHCRLKAHFRLCSEEGTKSDFETLLIDTRQELRVKAIGKIRRQYAEGELATDIPLSRAVLRKGMPFILSGHLEDDRYAIRFDGLRKVDGTSIIGDFHYEPALFSTARCPARGRPGLLGWRVGPYERRSRVTPASIFQ